METPAPRRDVKLIPIGNSKGIRLTRDILQKYGFTDSLVLVETEEGILLRKKEDAQLSWEETYRAMADEQEDWADFDATLMDGLEDDEPDTAAL